MIQASQSQKEAPKVAQGTAQSKNPTVQGGDEVFSLLLAMMNGQGVASDGLTSLSDTAADLADLDLSAIADQDSRAAKLADWLAAHPASLAALNAMGLSGSGLVASLVGERIQVLSGAAESKNLSSVKSQPVLGPLDAELVASMNNAGDAQSMAAALMAAVGSHVATTKEGESHGTSNLLLSRGLLGGLSLAKVLAQELDLSLGRFGPSTVDLSRTKMVSIDGDLQRGVDGQVAADQVVRTVHHLAFADAMSALPAGEHHQERLHRADALLTAVNVNASTGFQQPVAMPLVNQENGAAARVFEGAVSWLASQQGGVATVDLTPPELGSLRLELKVDAAGESATLVVHAANDAAKAAIEQSLDRLYESFQSSGMALQVSVGSGFSGFSNGMPNRFVAPAEAGSDPTGASYDGRSDAMAAPRPKVTSAGDALSLYA